MRVLHLINSLAEGGAENLLRETLPVMGQQGVNAELLLLLKRGNVFEEELKSAGITVLSTGLENLYSPRQALKIRNYLKSYDLVHVHLFPAQYWFALAGKLTRQKIPAVTTEHSTYNRRRNHHLLKFADQLVYQQYDKIVCVSEDVRENLLSWVPSISERAVTINNGIKLSRFREAEPYPLGELIPAADQNLKLILMAARMSASKDQKTLIRAVSLLPENYRLVLAGDGENKNELIAFTESLGIRNRVHFLGFRSDLNRIMKSADLFVLSSNWEGFGLAAVEAMAAGLPVIASNVSGLAKTVEGAGVLFPKGDYLTLAEKIREVLANEKYCAELSRASQKRAKFFTVEKMTEEYLKIYQQLLE